MRRFSLGLAASLAFGCSSSDEAKTATEVAVFVDGDQSVIDRLVRVRASVHALDALTTWTPLEQTEFVLAKGMRRAKGEVTVPFSFGVSQGNNDRFELVVEGFTSHDSSAAPTIERKVQVAFQPGKRIRVDMRLMEACYDLIKPCTDLRATCQPESRACGAVEEATASDSIPEDAPMDRKIDEESKDDAGPTACPADHGCSADYPCVPTGPGSYTCLGQMADWPMPIAGSKTPHQYDISDPRLVVDKVTGLVWQRELPPTYAGCTLTNKIPGDMCTWDEAKNYCAHLDLAGRKWRLPTKIELESIIDTTQGVPTLVGSAFLRSSGSLFWTSSISRGFEYAEGNMTRAWNVSMFTGISGFTAPSTIGAARCVSNGVLHAIGTPKDRYVVDMQAGTVSDRRTGLTWRRTPSPQQLPTLSDASRYCTNLGDGFRVPAMKEMLTLFDPNEPRPSIRDVFIDPPSNFAWAMVRRADGGLDTWYVDQYGSTYSMEVFDSIGATERVPLSHVRCVR